MNSGHRLANDPSVLSELAGQDQTIIGVTGTNGKTSVVEFTRQLLEADGRQAASWGTLGMVTTDGSASEFPVSIGRYALPLLVEDLGLRGIDTVAIEAYSTALDRGALDAISVEVAAFTNLQRDHLDYHGSTEAYISAKAHLFESILADDGVGVVNIEDEQSGRFQRICDIRGIDCITFGRDGVADITLRDYTSAHDASVCTLVIQGSEYDTEIPIVGNMMVENVMCAAAIARAVGMSAGDIVDAPPSLNPPSGRVERVETYNDAAIYVDYAHTPAALSAVLRALRERVRSDARLLVVFGCGGERDRGKRSQMGQIAARSADIAIVTDDNPRGEDPAAIRRTVLDHCPGGREMADREQAIRSAIDLLRPGDVLVVAGKGHETTQTVNGSTTRFSDHETVRSVVSTPE